VTDKRLKTRGRRVRIGLSPSQPGVVALAASVGLAQTAIPSVHTGAVCTLSVI